MPNSVMKFEMVKLHGALAALLLFPFGLMAREKAALAPPDLTQSITVDRSATYNLGSTGLRGWIYTRPETGLDAEQGRTTARSRQILVTHVGTNTPASGTLQVNDVILGVGDTLFDDDARKSFGRAITEAEKPENKGVMKLTIFRAGPSTGGRAGETRKVEIKLRVLGAYSGTAPYDCRKSERILAEASRVLQQEPLEKRWDGAISGLALLATGDKAALPKVQAFARSIQPGRLDPEDCATWDWGYLGLFLGEYYLATGDKDVLPALREIVVGLARAQYPYGTYGHRGAMRTKEGAFHGPPINGYGPIHAAGLIANIAIVVGKKCGIEDPEIEPAIERATRYFSYYVNKGAIPYGEHGPWPNHENNGKCSMAAVYFNVLGTQPDAAKYFARMATAGYANREYGHTGQGFSYLWGVMGANAGGPAAAAAFVKEAQWHLDLVRRCDGSFTYDGAEQYGAGRTDDNTYWGKSSYEGLSPTACYVLSYAVPLRKLCITGKDAPKSSWLGYREVQETIAAGRFDLDRKRMSVPELLKAFNDWSPVVRGWAAEELATRPEARALGPDLIMLAEGRQPNARGPACLALGALQETNAIPVLVRLLRHEDRGLRAMAANALGAMGEAARPVLPELLQILADTAEPTRPINWEDPIQFAHGHLAAVVFRGLLGNGLDRVDRRLVYPAFRAVSRNADSHARDNLSLTIRRQLTADDVRVLAPDLVKAIEELSPADIMWADGIRTAGLDVLSRLHIREGMALCVASMEPRWGNEKEVRLQYLLRYGAHAREVLPQLQEKRREDERDDALFARYIAMIEACTNTPPVIPLKEFMDRKTLKVFILAGQSNMEGHGKVDEGRNPDHDPGKPGSEPEIIGGLGSLRRMVTQPATAAQYKPLVDAKGQWVVRDDAWIYSTTAGGKKGKLSVGYGANGVWIGPEFGFGMGVADYCKDPILIIKTAWGGKSLGVDFRPPSSGKSTYAGNPEDEGKCYREMIRIVKEVCASVATDFPELKGRTIEFAGFGWNQGWNDQYDPAMVAEYGRNMANLITDVRKELNAPDLPFVIADTGQLGPATAGELAALCGIQMGMGDPVKHPEFKGTVTSVETRGFARPAKESPSAFDYHWNHNGESHYLVGEAMGKAMIELLKGKTGDKNGRK